MKMSIVFLLLILFVTPGYGNQKVTFPLTEEELKSKILSLDSIKAVNTFLVEYYALSLKRYEGKYVEEIALSKDISSLPKSDTTVESLLYSYLHCCNTGYINGVNLNTPQEPKDCLTSVLLNDNYFLDSYKILKNNLVAYHNTLKNSDNNEKNTHILSKIQQLENLITRRENVQKEFQQVLQGISDNKI